MTPGGRERLVLRIPADPKLARFIRLVSLHFFRHNGVRAALLRREAALVEARCRPLLRTPGGLRRHRRTSRRHRRPGSPDLVMTLISGLGEIEVTVRRGDDLRGRSILRLGRSVTA